MPQALLIGELAPPDPASSTLIRAVSSSLPDGWDVVTTPGPSGRAGGPANAARRLAGADAVVLAGGRPFAGNGSAAARGVMRSVGPLSVAASALGKPVALIGIGAERMPTRPTRALARAVVRRCDLLVLRDEDSARALADSGAQTPFRIGADPVWTELDRATEPSARHVGGIHVAVHRSPGAPDAGMLATGLNVLLSEGFSIRLQPWHNDSVDIESTRAVRAAIAGDVEQLDPPRDLVSVRDQMAQSDVVMSAGRSALLAAASAGTPFVALGRFGGLQDLAARFDQSVVTRSVGARGLAQAVLSAAAGEAPGAHAVRSEIAGAEESFRMLRLLLQQGDSAEADEITGLPLHPRRPSTIAGDRS